MVIGRDPLRSPPSYETAGADAAADACRGGGPGTWDGRLAEDSSSVSPRVPVRRLRTRTRRAVRAANGRGRRAELAARPARDRTCRQNGDLTHRRRRRSRPRRHHLDPPSARTRHRPRHRTQRMTSPTADPPPASGGRCCRPGVRGSRSTHPPGAAPGREPPIDQDRRSLGNRPVRRVQRRAHGRSCLVVARSMGRGARGR